MAVVVGEVASATSTSFKVASSPVAEASLAGRATSSLVVLVDTAAVGTPYVN